MSDTPKIAQFFQCVERLINNTQPLITLLEQETDILKTPCAESVQEIAQKKITHLDAIGQLQQELLCILGITSETDIALAMPDFIRELNPTMRQKATKCWQQLHANLTECQRLNTLNGSVIHHNLNRTWRRLEILSGKQKSTDTYDQLGRIR